MPFPEDYVAVASGQVVLSADMNEIRAFIAAVPAEVWSAQIWVEGGSPEIYIRWGDAGQANLAAVGPLTVSGDPVNGFRKYTLMSQTAPANTAFVRIEGYNQHATQVMHIDAASLVQEA